MALAILASPGSADAQSYRVLYAFQGGGNGAAPAGGLVSDKKGNLFGTTSAGGANNAGTVFELSAGGAQSVLYNFCSQPNCSDGLTPLAGLARDKRGNLAGTTVNGGLQNCSEQNGCGTVFTLAPNGIETVLHAFTNSDGDGANPLGGLMRNKAGDFFGTTSQGGGNCGGNPCGMVFALSPAGAETVLYDFKAGEQNDGQNPFSGVIADKQGNLYGTTNAYSGGYGAVYKIAPSGTETILYAFMGGPGDGRYPQQGNLVMDKAGNLYGETTQGGINNYGTVFKLAPNGTESVLYAFTGQPNNDGQDPLGGLAIDRKGNLYGTTLYGGTNCNGGGCGVVFKIAPNGTETVLHTFTGGADGANPFSGVIAAKKHILYGTTLNGGSGGNNGTVYAIAE
jgi:uncharacterized repeat protein (TIGR03803 family)